MIQPRGKEEKRGKKKRKARKEYSQILLGTGDGFVK